MEPNDVAVAAGQDVTLQCQADGYPKPSITWKKAVGKAKAQFVLILTAIICVSDVAGDC